MNVVLLKPNKEMKNQVLDFKKEFFDNNETEINGGELLDHIDLYDEWLQLIERNSVKETVNPDWVLTDTFIAYDKDIDKIIGIIDLRYELNDFLKNMGNCGYSVRPSERKKGYATEMLRQIVSLAQQKGMKELHLAAFRTNKPSIKTMINNGGVYERSFIYENETADIYVIKL